MYREYESIQYPKSTLLGSFLVVFIGDFYFSFKEYQVNFQNICLTYTLGVVVHTCNANTWEVEMKPKGKVLYLLNFSKDLRCCHSVQTMTTVNLGHDCFSIGRKKIHSHKLIQQGFFSHWQDHLPPCSFIPSLLQKPEFINLIWTEDLWCSRNNSSLHRKMRTTEEASLMEWQLLGSWLLLYDIAIFELSSKHCITQHKLAFNIVHFISSVPLEKPD